VSGITGRKVSTVLTDYDGERKSNLILDVTNSECECAWDSALKPIGEFWNREAFDLWWDRCQTQVGHLHPMIAEQWVHRPWGESPYRHLPIEQLRWCLEEWDTSKILEKVYVRRHFGEFHPDSDLQYIQNTDSQKFKSLQAHLKATGTWDYPIVVIETPEGVLDYDTLFPEFRFCLIEGHKRLRYLNVFASQSLTANRHDVFVLTLS
jgi:hypothetical protein